ncbi:hypothetical protein LSH36_109g02036 [Paralvinella palmiformis]|uniref:sn-1-specific diacylglycerol lipase ABHD11 n=1 Tax=Paralvinella palmiformis TaxID=53620 RepID=A0AAD9JYW4_9ANNE|nr:hypothetical protein LSH36_109g02036 [Paralvinella palmiformis]
MREILSKLLSYRISAISRELSRSCSTSWLGRSESPVLSYSNYQSTKVPPRDPPLIILHGLFGSKSNWSSLGKAFAASGRRVITVDARNHGNSSHVDSMDYLSMADDVERLMYQLDIHKAIILGHSMGGKTAMCLAINKPHLVEQLVVEDVSPDVSRTSAVTSFPQYLAVMRNINFDEQVKTLSEARKIAGSQIQSVFQVCITFNM